MDNLIDAIEDAVEWLTEDAPVIGCVGLVLVIVLGLGLVFAFVPVEDIIFGDDDTQNERQPMLARELAQIGIDFYLSEDYERALVQFEAAILLDSENATAYAGRGLILNRREDFQGARDDFSRAIELQPGMSDAYSERGNAHYQLEQYEAAIADYREYERLTRSLEPIMEERIAEMEAALAESN